ncbi:MAG: hypothetical protein IJY06_05255 [Oscillospiraceae bacterium]|nr:hypothetical protein [Oscillospiraceae bacterium]
MSRKRRLLIGICAAVLLAAPVFVPVKIALSSEEDAKKEEYYLVHHISEGSTDGPLWICYGDVSGEWDSQLVFVPIMTGSSPEKWLSSAAYHGEHFLVYGTLDAETQTLHCSGWDIVGEIHRDGETLRPDFRSYLTLLDLKWFDAILN